MTSGLFLGSGVAAFAVELAVTSAVAWVAASPEG